MTTINPNNRDLRDSERSALWQDVAQEIQQASPAARHKAAANPIMNIFTTTAAKGALALFVALGLIGGGAAADASKPGDALHGADLTLEKIRLALATSAEAKSNLRVRFAEERVEELDELLDEDPGTPETKAYVNAQAAIALAIEHLEAARAEADANENTDAALALDAIINRLNDRFAQLPDSAEYRVELRHRDDDDDDDHGARVEFRAEDDDDDTGFFVDDDGRVVRINKRVRVRLPGSVDASKFEDRDNDDHEEDETRLDIEVDIFSTYSTVEAHIGEFESKFRVEETDEEALITAIAAELEVSEDDVRSIISFEMEDDEDDHDKDDRDEDRDKDDDDEDEDDHDKTELEIDVDVYDGFADVKVETDDDNEQKFRVDSDVEAEIVAAIATKLGITEAEVLASMDLDIKTGSDDDHEEDDHDDEKDDDDDLLNNLL